MDVGWGQGSVFVLTGPCPLPHPVSEGVQAQGSASQVATAFESWHPALHYPWVRILMPFMTTRKLSPL